MGKSKRLAPNALSQGAGGNASLLKTARAAGEIEKVSESQARREGRWR